MNRQVDVLGISILERESDGVGDIDSRLAMALQAALRSR